MSRENYIATFKDFTKRLKLINKNRNKKSPKIIDLEKKNRNSNLG